MNTYWFTIKTTGFPEEQLVSISDKLYGLLEKSGGVDVLVAGDERGGEIEFSREAEDAVIAIVSAIEQVEQAGLEVVGVTEDIVDVDSIAERSGVSAAAVSNWTSGARGGGGFPRPVIERRRGSLWSWSQVSRWLEERKLGNVDHAAAEVARVARFFDAVLIARRDRDDVIPSYRQERVRGLLADLIA
ncbi:hypothetical protein GCM10009555_091070 [Acrocarpospora macrocephala]|uniref:DNA-binding protein n=1 Tax=Acrocarpospora macrocephala TaxID=150177 RepID=A0A5M3WQQ3_9ACTN|nr:hypothetical protein [Acrocarpospora macrocephala]GES09083.1 hypothetical protein Amac_026790 [Acrocarpospora macrocephala]